MTGDPLTDDVPMTGNEEEDVPDLDESSPPEFDPEEALKHQAIYYISDYDLCGPEELTKDMLQITIKIDGAYDTTKKDCTFGSIVVNSPKIAAILEMFIRVIEPFIKPPSKKERKVMLESELDELDRPKIIFRLWKGQTEFDGHSAFTIYFRGGRKNASLRDKIDARFNELCKGCPTNVNGLALRAILSDYVTYCFGKQIGETTMKLAFTQVFAAGSTRRLLSGKKHFLDGVNSDPDTRSYVPDGDYMLLKNKFFFWDCIQDTTFFWIGRSLLDDALRKLFKSVSSTLGTEFREDIRTITSTAAEKERFWGRWMTGDEVKRKQAEEDEKAKVEAAEAAESAGMTVEEIAEKGFGKSRKKQRASCSEVLQKILHARSESRKAEKTKLKESSDRVWTLVFRAMKHLQYLNGPIEAVTDAFKALEKEIDESGKYLSDDDLCRYFEDVMKHPSIQQRLPNPILGVLSHMREPQVSHRYPFLLHWGGKADMVSEIRKGFLDFFSALCGSDNCTAMGIELNTMRLTPTDIGRTMPQNAIFEGPASAGKSRTVEFIRNISCSGTVMGNSMMASAKSGAVALNAFDFATQISLDMGAALTKDYKTLNAQEQEKVMNEQIRISDQMTEYSVLLSKALEDRSSDAFQARESVHIESKYRGPSAYIANKGFSKPEMRARVQEFQIGLATTRALNMASSVVSECIDKSLSDKKIGGDGKDVSTEEMILEQAEEGKCYQAACMMNGLYRHIVEHDRYYTMPADIIALNLIKWLAEEYRGMQRMSSSVTNPRRMEACLKKIHANAVLRSYALMHYMPGGKYKFDPTKKEFFYKNSLGQYMKDLAQQQIGSTCEAIHAVATMLPDLCDENLARILKTIQKNFLQCADYDLTTKGGRARLCEKLHGVGSQMSGKVMFAREKKNSQQAVLTSGRGGNGAPAQNNVHEYWINPNYIEYHTDMTPEQFCKSIATKTNIGAEISSDAVHQKLFQDEKGKLLKDWGVTGVPLVNSTIGEDGADAVELENCGIVLKPINICGHGGRLLAAQDFVQAFEEDPAKPQIMRFGYRVDKDSEGRQEYVYTFAVAMFDATGCTKSPISLLKQVAEEKLPYKNQMFTGNEEIDRERIAIYIKLNHPEATTAREKMELAERYARVGLPIRCYPLDYTDRVQQVEICIRPTEQSPENFTFKNPRFVNASEEKNIVSVIEDVHSRNAFVRSAASDNTAVQQTTGYSNMLDFLRRKENVTISVSMDMLAWWPIAHRYRWTERQWVDEVLREPRAMLEAWNKYPSYYKNYMPKMMDNEDRRARLREFARRMDLNPEDTITNWLKTIVKQIASKSDEDLHTLTRNAYPVERGSVVDERSPSVQLLNAFVGFQKQSSDVSSDVDGVDLSKINAINHETPTPDLVTIITAMEKCSIFGGEVLRDGDISRDQQYRLMLKEASNSFDKARRRQEAEDDRAYALRMQREGRDSNVLKPVPMAAPAERRERYVSSQMNSTNDAKKKLRNVLYPSRTRSRPTEGGARRNMEKAKKETEKMRDDSGDTYDVGNDD